MRPSLQFHYKPFNCSEDAAPAPILRRDCGLIFKVTGPFKKKKKKIIAAGYK